MHINPLYIVMSARKKQEKLFSYAMQDKFMAVLLHDFNDFGSDITFPLFGGAGAYQPFALSTEKLDSPEKQQLFASGFWAMAEAGNMKAKMQFSALLGGDANAHIFLHEMMHFYQDMHGLYLLPLQEQGVFPIMLDAHSDIIAMMFCEAWAETEAIRTSWALREQGDARGWSGAIKSPDWSDLARAYDTDLQDGVDEAKAAADTFHRWYESDHRSFYERYGLEIYEANLARYKDGAEGVTDQQIAENLRRLELPMLLIRLPKEGMPKFFQQIDWENEAYTTIKTPDVLARVSEIETPYGAIDNPNIQDIKCGAPPYLWHRLRMAEQKSSEVPPH